MLPYIAYMDPMGTEIIPNKWIRMGKMITSWWEKMDKKQTTSTWNNGLKATHHRQLCSRIGHKPRWKNMCHPTEIGLKATKHPKIILQVLSGIGYDTMIFKSGKSICRRQSTSLLRASKYPSKLLVPRSSVYYTIFSLYKRRIYV
jgi:hypothetical protein